MRLQKALGNYVTQTLHSAQRAPNAENAKARTRSRNFAPSSRAIVGEIFWSSRASAFVRGVKIYKNVPPEDDDLC